MSYRPNASVVMLALLVAAAIFVMLFVPYALRMQVASIAARTENDLRFLASNLEVYLADHGSLPRTGSLHTLTTPVAYQTVIGTDAFADTRGKTYQYASNGTRFIVGSFGPDTDEATGGDLPWSDADAMNALLADETRLAPFTYDPRNGASSNGDLWRIGGKAGKGASP